MLILLLFYWEIKLKKLCKLVSISLFVYEKVLPSGQKWAKSPKKQSVGVYFECRINKNKTHSFKTFFDDDFAH